MDSRPKAVVIGLGHAGLGLTRSLSQSGVDVAALADNGEGWARWTRFGQKVFRDLSPPGALTKELITLGKDWRKRAALFLTSDAQVREVSSNRVHLKPYYEINLPDEGALDALNNKRLFHESAVQRGLPVPTAYCVNSIKDVKEAGAAISYPCILKSSYRTSEWDAYDIPKVFKCKDANELTLGYNVFMRYNPDCVIQEWVPGGDGNIYFCFAYRPFNKGETIYFTGRKIRQWPPYCGSTSVAEPCESKEAKDITRRVIEAFDLRGYVSVELKRHERLGNFLIMEPTVGRVNLQFAVTDAAGLKLPFLMYCDSIGAELPKVGAPRKGVKWIYEPYEMRSARYYMKNEGLSFKEWRASLRGSRHYALYRWDDPLPFMSFLSGALWGRLRTLVRRASPPKP